MSVLGDLRDLVRSARERAGEEERPTLASLDALFDMPLRVAFVGMVKAGKSTLLNALVGQRVAPTDAGECTTIVTFYERGRHYAVTAIGRDGSEEALRFERGDELVVYLEGRDPAGIDHLEVRWPSDRLADRQLIDTPGLGSLSSDVSARSEQFLSGDGELPVDAVVYLSRHRHPSDVRFLEAFHGGVSGAGPMSAIVVLSRADELAGGRVDSLAVAADVAKAMGAEDRIRRVAQTVVPVAGLLAETAATLRQDEFDALRAIAAGPADDVALSLLSVDRFVGMDIDGVDEQERRGLLGRLGLFGLRLAVELIRSGRYTTASSLAEELSARSGIADLQGELRRRFEARRLTLRSRAVLASLSSLDVAWSDAEIAAGLERIRTNAHELVEMETLDDMAGLTDGALGGVERERLERLLGFDGVEPWRRLGLEPGASQDTIRRTAGEELSHWRTEAEHPLATPTVRHLARVATRTCESMMA